MAVQWTSWWTNSTLHMTGTVVGVEGLHLSESCLLLLSEFCWLVDSLQLLFIWECRAHGSLGIILLGPQTIQKRNRNLNLFVFFSFFPRPVLDLHIALFTYDSPGGDRVGPACWCVFQHPVLSSQNVPIMFW